MYQKKTIPQKAAALTATLIIIISVFVLPLASCVEYGYASIDSKQFDRYYCHSFESTYGYGTSNQYDTAYITAVFNDYAYEGQIIQARLFKYAWCTEDGLTALFSIGECWIDTENQFFSGYPPTFNFQHNLDYTGIVWPNNPAQVAAYCGTIFGNLEWNVCYRINWWYIDSGFNMYEIGWSDELPGYKVWTSHDEMEPEENNYIICSCCTHFACHTSWTDIYGTASITSPEYGHGRTADGNRATLRAQSSGATARICYDLTSLDTGDVYIRGRSMHSPSSRVLVYCSANGNSWTLASDKTVSATPGDTWINFGNPGISYRYVLILAYDDGSSDSYIAVDCVNTGGHY